MAILTANNQSLTEITALPSVITPGSLVLLATETASGSATIDFTSNIDSTYPLYVFKFIDIHPSASYGEFQVGFRDGSTAYDATKTTTSFRVYADEADTTADATVAYTTAKDIAQGTGFQIIMDDMNNDNDGCGCGTLQLFDTSSTTFVKHFISRTTNMHGQPASFSTFVSGYCNTTTAIDGVQFKFSSGTIDAGTIKMYGVT